MWDGIKDQYIIAYFDEECIREIEGKLPFKTAWAQSKDLVGNTWSQIKKCKGLKDILVRNFLFILTYLYFHFSVQLLYQFDWFCLPQQRNGNFTFAEFEPDINGTNTKALNINVCKLWAQTVFMEFNAYMMVTNRVITFLVGFYVSTIVKRWFDQIKLVPSPDNVCLFLGAMVHFKPNYAKEELVLKKKIIRYLHLSWVLALSSLCPNLFQFAVNPMQCPGKEMMKPNEVAQLQPYPVKRKKNLKLINQKGIRWFLPLNWAIIEINKSCNEENPDKKITKDPKDLVGQILKFRTDLEHLREYGENPLPIIFSYAVWLCIIGWLSMGLFGAQNILHHSDAAAAGLGIYITVAFSFPLYELLTFLLIITWVQAADELKNPFRTNPGYDVDLVAKLHINLWKSSLMLQNQQEMLHNNKEVRFEIDYSNEIREMGNRFYNETSGLEVKSKPY